MLRRPEKAPQGVGWALPSPRPVLIDELRCRRLRAQRRAHVSQSTVARRGGVRRPVPRITALFHRLRLVLAQVGVECGLGGGVGGVAQVVARVNRAARLPRDCVRPRVGGANGVCTIALESVLSPELSRGRPRSPEIARDHTRLPPDAADGLAARIAPVERVRLGDQPPVGDGRDVSWTRTCRGHVEEGQARPTRRASRRVCFGSPRPPAAPPRPYSSARRRDSHALGAEACRADAAGGAAAAERPAARRGEGLHRRTVPSGEAKELGYESFPLTHAHRSR